MSNTVNAKPRIVFMGSPDFAVASLEAILRTGYPVIAVVTAPDKPAGRGMQPSATAMKKFALGKGLKILQPEKLRDPGFLAELRALEPDLQVVVAFRMLPQAVWSMPPLGTINLHASLLPQYRGAAPINWAIINGESTTGLTTFQLDQEIDTGNLLLQEKLDIMPEETAGELYERMKLIGAELVVKTVRGLASHELKGIPQDSATATGGVELRPAPKIHTETCRIHWDRPVRELHNLVRGLSPHPGAFTQLGGKTLKILRSSVLAEVPPAAPGQWISDRKTFLKFTCADGCLSCLELQLEGKKKMPVADFLRGYRFPEND